VGVSIVTLEKDRFAVTQCVGPSRRRRKLGTKVEVKNMNSFRAVKDAIDYEIKRQIESIESGGRIVQETRLWNEARGASFAMVPKKRPTIIRTFPEPDLVTLKTFRFLSREIRKACRSFPERGGTRLIKD